MKIKIRYVESSSDRKMFQKYDKMGKKKGNHTFCVMKYAYHLLVENVEIRRFPGKTEKERRRTYLVRT
jgi:hypothetical protein